MKKLLFLALAFVPVFAATAHAAAPAAITWNGFYAGAHLGYEFMSNQDNLSSTDGGVSFLSNGSIPGSMTVEPNAVFAGFQAGYNYRVSPLFVVGAETDLSGMDAYDETSAPSPNGDNRTLTAKQQMNMLGTLRARFGVVATDNILAYVTGGLAYGHGNLSTGVGRLSGCAGNNCQAGSTAGMLVGWSAGAGGEYALDSKWSLKGEYLHYDLGSLSHLMADPAFPGTTYTAKAAFTGDLIRIGVNYNFD